MIQYDWRWFFSEAIQNGLILWVGWKIFRMEDRERMRYGRQGR